MARGPFWLCTELKIIRENMDKTDHAIAAMLPGRKAKSVEDFRRKLGLHKRQSNPKYPTYPQADTRRAIASGEV